MATVRIRKPHHLKSPSSALQNLEENLIQSPLGSTTSAWLSQTSLNNRYQHKILSQRRHVSFALQAHKQATSKNEERIRELSSTLHRLQLSTKRMNMQGLNYKSQLSKLYQAQGLESFMWRERERRKSMEMEELERKRQVCSEVRVNGGKRLEMSRTAYKELMRKRIEGAKERSQRASEERSRIEEGLREMNREKYWKVKVEENELKMRQRRIEEFKIKRARKNYLMKIEQEMEKRQEQDMKLKELAEIQRVQIEALQQTQKLERESKHIEKLFENFFATEG